MFNFKTKEKKLQEITEVFSELKAVERDIKEMGDFVQAVVDGEIKTMINLKGERLTKEYDPDEGYEDDEPRQIIRTFFSGSVAANISKRAEEDYQYYITENLDEALLLQVMAVLLKAKEEYRDYLASRLEKHGLKL